MVKNIGTFFHKETQAGIAFLSFLRITGSHVHLHAVPLLVQSLVLFHAGFMRHGCSLAFLLKTKMEFLLKEKEKKKKSESYRQLLNPSKDASCGKQRLITGGGWGFVFCRAAQGLLVS